MVTLYKRGRVWWACATVNGQRTRWSLKTRDRDVALRLKQREELRLLSGGSLVNAEWAEFRREFDQWVASRVQRSTIRSYGFVLRRFDRFVLAANLTRIEQITPAVVSAFAATKPHREDSGGVKFDLRVLHRLFSYAIDCGYITRNPVLPGNLNATPGKTMPFSRDEVAAMLALCERRSRGSAGGVVAQPDLRAIVMTFLHTGLRVSDVATLRRDAVSRDAITLQTRKRRKTVRIPLHPDLAASIAAHLRVLRSRGPLLFPATHGRPLSMAQRLRRLCAAAGIENGHPHRFRDTFSVELLQRGASLYDVAKLLGISAHTAERHYAPYVKALQDRAAKLVSSLDYNEK